MVMDANVAVKLTLEAERFRNHAAQVDRRLRDWPAGWRNWVLGAIDKAPAAVGIGSAPKGPADPWPSRVRAWKADEGWNRVDWGPPPGEPGCKCPPGLLT
jgi:hypothetical protein